MKRNILKTTIIVVVFFASCFMTGCQKEENISNQDILENSSLEIEEYIIAGLEYQHALNIFNNEIKNIDFSKLDTYQDSKGNTIVNIPTSVSIEEKTKIFNEKKKLLLDKCPQIVLLTSDIRMDYFQQCIQNSININKKALELGININRVRLKGFSLELHNDNDYCTYLDAQLSNNNSNYVEIVLNLFEDGTSMTYIDSRNSPSGCYFPALYRKASNNKWYVMIHDNSPISYIAHTHRYSSNPSPEDIASKVDYPGLEHRIYTSGCNTTTY
jgi:hypothetical protein